MTEAMRDTPGARLERRARYWHWDSFPVNPDRWYEKLAGRRSPTDVLKGRSFAVTRQLRERLARHDKTCRGDADRLALYRAFRTIGIELAERGDDSYGNIGELRLEAFTSTSASTRPRPAWNQSAIGRICANCSSLRSTRSPTSRRRSHSTGSVPDKPR